MSESPIKINLSGDLTPISEGLKANLASTPSAFQKLFITFCGQKYADNMYYAILKGTQAGVDAQKILSGEYRLIDNELVELENKQSLPSLIEIKTQEESENLVGCVTQALIDSGSRPDEPNKQPISDKFFAKWRSEAVFASTLEDQQLWGKILSEENHHPGSFSLRTLYILKNIDKETAQIFERICDYVINDNTILLGISSGFGENDCTDKHISNDDIAILANIGLISQISLADVFESKDGRMILQFSNYRIIIQDVGKIFPSLRHLTMSGKQLYQIAKVINDEKICQFCKFILSARNPNITEVHYYDSNNMKIVGDNMVETKIVKL